MDPPADVKTDAADLDVGDLVFYANGPEPQGHVAIVVEMRVDIPWIVEHGISRGWHVDDYLYIGKLHPYDQNAASPTFVHIPDRFRMRNTRLESLPQDCYNS